MHTDPKPKDKSSDNSESLSNNDQYIEPEAIDGLEPEDLDSDDEDI